MLPIVEPRALHFAFVERKTKRLDQMKCRAGREARATGVTGIPMNLGMDENDVYRHLYQSPNSGAAVGRTMRPTKAAVATTTTTQRIALTLNDRVKA